MPDRVRLSGERFFCLLVSTALAILAAGCGDAKVTVSSQPPAPVVVIHGPYSGTVAQPVSFSAAGTTDPGGLALAYSWTFGDGGTGTGSAPSHTYTAMGSFTVRLVVTNSRGTTATASTTATITSTPQAPVANAGGPYTGIAGTQVTFSGAGSNDPYGQALSFAWSFGDGTSGNGAAPAHTYTVAGNYTVSLTVTNTSSLSASASATAIITAPPPTPQSPVANAGGPYAAVTGASITFNSTGSTDPQKQALTYSWNFGDGAAGTGSTPVHSYSKAGSYTVALTVTNTSGLTATATTTATITSPPPSSQPPTADAGGPYSGNAGSPVAFSGARSTDPKQQTLTYSWNFGDGSSGSGIAPTHTYASGSTYTVTLIVTNTDGLTSTATAIATISPAQPTAPIANPGGPYTGTTGTAINFSGAGSSDPRGKALTYAWNFGDGSTASGVSPQHAYSDRNTYTVTLTVINTDGLSAKATTTATVSDAPASPPTANPGGPYTGTAGVAVAFNGSASSDPRGQSLTYAWSFGDNGTANTATPTHIYAVPGTYTVQLTVTNTNGISASANTTATVSPQASQPPKASAGGPYTGTANFPIAFTALGSSDPAGKALTYAWNFGDGSSATGPVPSHTYAAAGTFAVVLTATNSDGASASATTSATVTAPAAQAPVAVAGGPYAAVAGAPLSLGASGSYDPQNPGAGPLALSLAWNFGDGAQGAGPSPVHTYAKSGTYQVSLTATNKAGLSSTTSTAATVDNPNVPQTNVPTAVPGGPYSGTINNAVTFSSAGSSNPAGGPLQYSWQFGDGSGSGDANPTHVYTGAGTYSVTLTVNNSTGTAAAGTTAAITDPTPAVPLTAKAGGPYTVAVNQPLQLDATGTTSDGKRQLSYTWDFGDNTTGSGPVPAHTYRKQGTFTASVVVRDGLGGSSNASAQVTVGAPAAETVTASAGGPYADLTGRSIIFDASGSSDNLGNSLSYAWTFSDGGSAQGVSVAHTFATAGAYTASVTATGVSQSATAMAPVTVSAPLGITITSPAGNALFGTNGSGGITVSGTVSSPGVSVAVNGSPAQVSGTTFTASNVSLREGVNLLTATATDSSGGVGTAATSVILDVTAPGISITSPVQNAVVSVPSVSVAGLVSDIVTGTIGSNEVTVTVNGVAATVLNRSYLIDNVALTPGANTITAIVTDKVGNTGKATTVVTYQPPVNQLSMVALSGTGQTGVTRSVLTKPLVVQVLSATGTPVAGRPVTFTVTRSDGQVEVMPTIAQALAVTTDAAGKASVLFQLGSRAGLGVNQVTASTPGVTGSVLFTASSTVGTPAQIHIVRGEHQRGLIGQPLAEAMQVLVEDAYGNPVPGITTTFSVSGGDGTIDNPSPVTDTNGKAFARLTLGQQEGINNYAVTATFANNAGAPITFLASGFAPGAVSATQVSGIVLDNANTPVVNASVRLAGTAFSTVTDANGRFSFQGAPTGTVTLTVDGSTSTSTKTFPFLSFLMQSLPGQNNTLDKPVYLPAIDVDNGKTVGGDDPVVLTIAGVSGSSFTVAPHSVTFPDGSTVGKLSISQVKSDMVPMEPTNGSSPDLIWTIQPAGTRFSTPVAITFPNSKGLAPGQVTEFFQYDHDLEQFVSAGTAHVSADGSTILSDPGFGITKAGWGHILTTSDPTACVESCNSTDPCISTKLFKNNCLCATFANVGADCGESLQATIGYDDQGRPILNEESCKLPGKCDANGKCNGPNSPAGQYCPPPSFCDISAQCNGRGSCISTGTVPDKNQLDPNGAGWKLAAQNNLSKDFLFFNKLLNEIGAGFIHVQANVTGTTTQNLICCSALKQMNVAVDDDSLQPSLQIQTDQIPIIINGVQLGKSLGDGQVLGFYFVPVGTLQGTYTHHFDHCTGQSCSTLVFNPSVQLQVGFNIPPSYVGLNLNAQFGIQANVGGGCGTATLSMGFTPLVVTGTLKFFSNSNISASYTTRIPFEVGGTFPVQ